MNNYSKVFFKRVDYQNNLGFSLLEIMVVLSIVSMLAYVSIPSISGNKEYREVVSESEKILYDLQYIHRKATFEAVTVNLRLNKRSYDIFIVENKALQNERNNYAEINSENTLISKRNIADYLDISLIKKNSLNPRGEHKEIVFFEDGQYTPFEIRLKRKNKDRYITIDGNGLNKITILNNTY